MTDLEQAYNLSNSINLIGTPRKELESYFTSIGESPFRARQIMRWVYQEGIFEFEKMTDLSLVLRERLKQNVDLSVPKIVYEQSSLDGTRKWLLRLVDGNCIEAVFIPEDKRGTLCISSQVGCVLNCSFCSTARQGFNRNLTRSEIVSQLLLTRQVLRDDLKTDRPITNIVFMGMGEPLANFDAVVDAANVMMDDLAFGLGKRRVTISTAGIVPAILRLSEQIDVSLAVSLHAPTNDLRDRLVPLNKKYPLEQLIPACHRFAESMQRKFHITFEYVMLDGVNDQPQNAHQLLKLLKGLPAKVNLIPFNPFPEASWRTSSPMAIQTFQEILMSKGLHVMVRKTRGSDIDAACGQLAGKIMDRTRRSKRIHPSL